MDRKEETEKFLLEFRSHDVNLRIGAIVKLGQTESKYYLNLLLLTAKYETDITARIALIKSICNQKKLNKTINETLLSYSMDTNSQVRKSSIEALDKLSSKLLTRVLLERLEDFDQDIRFFCMDIAGSKRIKKCTGKIISILNEATDNETIVRASRALGEIQDPKVVEPLFAKFHNGPIETRAHLSTILTLFGDKPKDKFLRILSESDDIQLLQLSIGALQAIGGEDIIEPILNLLTHIDPNVQNEAAKAMINLDETTKYLINKFLEEPEIIKIHEILSNKGRIALEDLLNLKTHDNNIIRDKVDIILHMLMNQSQKLLSSTLVKQMIDATEVYIKLFDEEHPIDNLMIIKQQIEINISNEDSEVQKISLKAIRKLGDSASIEPVQSILKNSNDDGVIIEALITLGAFEDEQPIVSIKNKLKDAKMEIRREVYIALGRIWQENPDLIDDTLKEMLYDTNLIVKLEAMSIAQKLKSPISIEPLKELAFHGPNNDIREKASSILNDLQSHFIEILSSPPSKYALGEAINSLVKIERSNDSVIGSLFDIAQKSTYTDIRQSAVYALGSLGNEAILEHLDEIDISNPEVRKAKNWAEGKIKNLAITSEDSFERLRRGDIPDEPVDILRILNEQDHSIFGDYSADIGHQLNEAIKNFEGERWGESINRINNVCENITKAIIVDKESELEIPNLDDFIEQDQRTRINILGARADFIERKDVFSTSLLQIHLYRIESDAQHAGGEITTPSNAFQAIHALREIYLIAEKLFRENGISE